MRTLLMASVLTLAQAQMWTDGIVDRPADVPSGSRLPASPTSAVQPAYSPETQEERRARGLATVSDDPALQCFYDRCVPRNITPSAWMPFWPSVSARPARPPWPPP